MSPGPPPTALEEIGINGTYVADHNSGRYDPRSNGQPETRRGILVADCNRAVKAAGANNRAVEQAVLELFLGRGAGKGLGKLASRTGSEIIYSLKKSGLFHDGRLGPKPPEGMDPEEFSGPFPLDTRAIRWIKMLLWAKERWVDEADQPSVSDIMPERLELLTDEGTRTPDRTRTRWDVVEVIPSMESEAWKLAVWNIGTPGSGAMGL